MPTSKEIWNRINGRVLELHPKVACTKPSSSPQGSIPKTCSSTLTRHFLPFNSKCVHSSSPRPPTVKTESGHEYLVLTHDSSSSILSVRLPPIDERSLSISGRIAIKGLREKQCFPHEKSLQWWNLYVSTFTTGSVFWRQKSWKRATDIHMFKNSYSKCRFLRASETEIQKWPVILNTRHGKTSPHFKLETLT